MRSITRILAILPAQPVIVAFASAPLQPAPLKEQPALLQNHFLRTQKAGIETKARFHDEHFVLNALSAQARFEKIQTIMQGERQKNRPRHGQKKLHILEEKIRRQE